MRLPFCHSPRCLAKVGPALAWTALGVALWGIWQLYTQPDFLVTLADQLWSCF